ncbi:MAG: hypothetical protein JW982_02980 [Spirochaetes bacterium]|nr:hypothetical protein [Spirochaetota bacterium]
MKNNDEIMAKLPHNGRIGRLVKILEKENDRDAVLDILEDADRYDILNDGKKSAWWKNAIDKMEQIFGKEKSEIIMRSCGAKCCGKGQRETAKRLMIETGSLDKFLTRISKHDVKEGELTYSLKNKNTIIADHNKCFCKQVANTESKFSSLTYCQCSVEFNKQFFTAALGKEVHVELLQSIICGADSCRFKITF